MMGNDEYHHPIYASFYLYFQCMTSPLDPKEKSSSNAALRIVFTKLGVLSGTYQQILYDSTTRALSILNISASSTAQTEGGKRKLSSSQGLSQSQSDKKLTDSAQTKLRQSINNSGFFQADGIYPPNPDGAKDYTLVVLGINMDSKSHTVIWADTSSSTSTGLNSVVKILEDIASK